MKAGIKQAFSKPQGCTLPLSLREELLLSAAVVPLFSLQSGLHWQNFSQKFWVMMQGQELSQGCSGWSQGW